ncbi:MAG: sensor histidine kinase [Putridiphycobacter sp.]
MNEKNLISKYLYHIILLVFIGFGVYLIQNILRSYYQSKENEFQQELIKNQEETALRIETGINVYSTIVSSIKSFVQNSKEFPNDSTMQRYLSNLMEQIDFKDSIAVSFVDTNQIFQYTVTPHQIDPYGLKGMDVKDLRTPKEIAYLNKIMYEDEITLFAPINLYEGWAAFPFNFSAKNYKGEVLGYIAPVLNVKYLLNYSYQNQIDTNFVHRFVVEDSINFSREVVYNGNKIYNENRDSEFYKNYEVDESDFIYSIVDFYDLKIKIGTAYKIPYKQDFSLATFIFIWYGLTCILSFIALNQLLKNKLLNQKMRLANVAILEKNEKLNENYQRIQTLLKEVHHRVKNNMQIISSLLNLQRNTEQNSDILNALDTSKSRIQSMALVHQKLYGSGNFANVNVLDYVNQLVVNIESTLENANRETQKNIDIDKNLTLSMDTILPLGLILNELITNSYKYAFKDNQEPKIDISIAHKKSNYVLKYADNGPGISKEIDFENSGTLGLELIHILSDQLKGSVAYNNSEKSTFIIIFNEIKA